MDFQSAMETFAEAWVAANTKNDQVQSQALALTHKASPPSRPSSEPSLPRTPPSTQPHQQQQQPQQQQQQQQQQQPSSQQSQSTATRDCAQTASMGAQNLTTTSHQVSIPAALNNHQVQPAHNSVAQGTTAQQQQQPYAGHKHLKQELNASLKEEGFDLSKTASTTGKSLPVHCVVEAIHSIIETRPANGRENWRRPHVELDTYVFIPANMPFQDLVGEVLLRLNYSSDLILTARGSIAIRNWKPLPTDKVAEGPLLTVGDILAELVNLATLKIQVYRSRPPPPTPASEVRDKLLRLLLLRSHAVLVAAGCPLDEATLSSLCRGGNDLTEETQRNFESWLQQQHLGLNLNPLIQPSTNHHHRAQSPAPSDVAPTTNNPPLSHHHPGTHHPNLLVFSHKSRMRTSFDPELELPRLQRWFAENQHPTRQQIQHYVNELNSLESRRDRKPLHVNNVVYWFKNARAAQKRAETRGVNGYSPPGLSPRGASNVSEDCTDDEEDSRQQSTSPSPLPPASPPIGPLSLTTRPEDQQQQNQQQQQQQNQQHPPSSTSSSSVKQEDPSRGGMSSGSEDDEASPTGAGGALSGFSLVPSPMFSHSVMYMSHYLSPRGPANCPTSILDERRKRNRTFIDPVTEVPRLETWFTHNTHPSHALILKYTEELNRMPYRQKFPRLEPKNVQFWFKNRRAKCKRLKMALFDGDAPQPHPYHAE